MAEMIHIYRIVTEMIHIYRVVAEMAGRQVVSHDQDFLNSVCQEIIHLEDKKLIGR